jgi:hypothetical protein
MAALIDETFASQSQLKFDDVLADAVSEVLNMVPISAWIVRSFFANSPVR